MAEGRVERVTVHGNFQTNNGDAILRLLLNGVGLCYAADFAVGRMLRDGRLVPVLTDYAAVVSWPIHAVYPARHHLPAKLRAFHDFLFETFPHPPPWQSGDPQTKDPQKT